MKQMPTIITLWLPSVKTAAGRLCWTFKRNTGAKNKSHSLNL